MSLRLGTDGRRDYRPMGLRRVRPVDSRPLAGNDSDGCGNPRPGPESRRPGRGPCRLQLGAQSRPVPERAMRITRVRLAAVAAPGHVGPAQGPAARPTRTEWPGRFRQREEGIRHIRSKTTDQKVSGQSALHWTYTQTADVSVQARGPCTASSCKLHCTYLPTVSVDSHGPVLFKASSR